MRRANFPPHSHTQGSPNTVNWDSTGLAGGQTYAGSWKQFCWIIKHSQIKNHQKNIETGWVWVVDRCELQDVLNYKSNRCLIKLTGNVDKLAQLDLLQGEDNCRESVNLTIHNTLHSIGKMC